MKSCSCKQRAQLQLMQNFDGERNVGNTITSRQESPVGEVQLLFVALIYGAMYVTTGHGKYFQSISCLLGMSLKARLWMGLKAKDQRYIGLGYCRGSKNAAAAAALAEQQKYCGQYNGVILFGRLMMEIVSEATAH